jgi:hypothetical protein
MRTEKTRANASASDGANSGKNGKNGNGHDWRHLDV